MSENNKINKTNEEWKKELDPEVYHVTREGGTETPFKNKYHDNKEKGIYYCSNCGEKLFMSDNKFDSGTGWPSFDKPSQEENLSEREDRKFLMKRVEVSCSNCGAHLGHVFDDGPKETTGKRYCLNSLSLDFKTEKYLPSEK